MPGSVLPISAFSFWSPLLRIFKSIVLRFLVGSRATATLKSAPQPAMLYPAGHAKEVQNQEPQCNTGKAAHNRHPVAPANGEPSQPCQPQDESGNVTHDACTQGFLAPRRGAE